MAQQDSSHLVSDSVGDARPQATALSAREAEFIAVQRPWDSTPSYQHKTRPVWVTHFPVTTDRAEHWQAYRAVAKVPAGRAPWTVDNRRVGTDRGFASLEMALAAAGDAHGGL